MLWSPFDPTKQAPAFPCVKRTNAHSKKDASDQRLLANGQYWTGNVKKDGKHGYCLNISDRYRYVAYKQFE